MPYADKEKRLAAVRNWYARCGRQWKRQYDKSPMGRFQAQKSAARQRGIHWQLTFDEWWSLWEPHWDQRGRRRGQLVMARQGDTGPYAIGNVRIATVTDNIMEKFACIGR